MVIYFKRTVFLLSFLLAGSFVEAKQPIKVLYLTGQNNHYWRASANILIKYLNQSELFKTDIAISPDKGENMSIFRPSFSEYGVVVLDYNGESWSDETKADFLNYVKNGGGVVVYHAADNSFSNWKEFNEIIGLGGWGGRNENSGPYVYIKDGKIVRDDSPGHGGSHGSQHEYKVVTREKEHPVMKGLPEEWIHAQDELYDRLRGPALNMTILATAFSDKSTGGTGRDEPVLMTVNWGKGRIFHTVLGHVGNEAKHIATDCPGFIATFLRGTEWAATGKVTQKVPANFPKNKNKN
ncbi:MAG: ThuA domain-containing protein [Prevotellaceae bacterium]|jgi:type 1 glutamine amidotransferase|nr:ThuA domain-containing protein [Prevotellaceae bacterium]